MISIIQRGLASLVYKFFDKKTAGSGIKSISSRYVDLINRFNKGFNFLSCVIDNFSKYA